MNELFFYWILLFSLGLIGIYILLRSPIILKLNKEKNSCTRETKFVWQKEYKGKTLCKLSEIKKAERCEPKLSAFNILYLKLRQGKDIAVFFAPSGGALDYTADFIEMENKINHFFNSNDKECVIKHSLFQIGVIYVAAWFSALLMLSCVIYYSD